MIDLMIVGLVPTGVPARLEEYVKSLHQNVLNEHVKKIVLVEEESPVEDMRLDELKNPKVTRVRNGRRLTFATAIALANQMVEPGGIACMINADAWIDGTISKLKSLNWDKVLVAISRDANSDPSGADCWLFKTPLNLVNIEVEFGRTLCDQRVCAMAQNAGMTVLNPSTSILVHHEHKNHPGYGRIEDMSTLPPWGFSILAHIEG